MYLVHLFIVLIPTLALCKRSPIIEIEQGKIRGVVRTDWKGERFYSFLSVPYAKPPIGELRFKDPLPAEKWQGILEATNDMPKCVQINWKFEIVGQEDCLYMNIHTPKVSTKNLKPVMLFIYGGGFVEGSGTTDMYGPEFLIAEGVVVVTMQYRVGLFGFLNFDNPKIKVPGNAGLKDQNLALKWVRRNIEIFGGDPKSITLFGTSAGGVNVHLHLLSPLSQGLIHRVISESGTALNFWRECQKNTGIIVAKALNYPTDDEKKVLEYLQSASIENIMKAQENSLVIPPIHERPLAGPIVETLHSGDIFLAQSPDKIISKGSFRKIPFMLGFTNNEAIFIYVFHRKAFGKLKTVAPQQAIPFPIVTKDEKTKDEIFQSIKEQYAIKDYRAGTTEYTKLLSDMYIVHGTYLSVKEHSNINHKDLYLYKFSADTKLNYAKRMTDFTSKIPGASHADELGYIFKNLFTPEDLTSDSIEGQNIQKMVKLWTNFAKYGKPTLKENELGVTWKPVTRDTMHYVEISTDSLTAKVNPFNQEDMTFWDKLLGKSVNLEHTEL